MWSEFMCKMRLLTPCSWIGGKINWNDAFKSTWVNRDRFFFSAFLAQSHLPSYLSVLSLDTTFSNNPFLAPGVCLRLWNKWEVLLAASDGRDRKEEGWLVQSSRFFQTSTLSTATPWHETSRPSGCTRKVHESYQSESLRSGIKIEAR